MVYLFHFKEIVHLFHFVIRFVILDRLLSANQVTVLLRRDAATRAEFVAVSCSSRRHVTLNKRENHTAGSKLKH